MAFAWPISEYYRDEYFRESNSSFSGLSRFFNEREQFDFSSHYNINDNFRVTFEVINIADEPVREFEGAGVRLRSSFTTDRTL